MIPPPDATDPTPASEVAAGTPAAAAKPFTARVIGVGGAGANAVARMAETDLRALRLVALHTSARLLEPIQGPEKILIGSDLTHGLGAGGDPSLARAAAERDLPLLKRLCADVDLLFVVTGLGGGTGTGIAPVLARVAKEAGALVIGVATLPFELEGPRRRRQAQQGLAELKAAADTVICMSNQKIFCIVDEKTSVLDSLKIANDLLAQGIRGIWHMLTRPSLLHVDFAHLCSALRDRHAESCFATVEAHGEGRARELIERLLAYPLLDGGQALAEADAVLVSLTGGQDMSMADVKRVMEEINRRTENAQVIMGASIAECLQDQLGLTLVISRQNKTESGDPGLGQRFAPSLNLNELPSARESRLTDSAPADLGGRRYSPPPPVSPLEPTANGTQRLVASGDGRVRSSRLQQGHLALEIVSKGRFEKSQPTIHRGEDLDIPTYVRRGIPLN
ncbi:MAG: cell division protein FtsZ [Verrucomicrobiota bacterium]